MSSTIVISACALVLLAATVLASPVLPEVALKDMHLEHSCVFMCEMCFNGHEKELLYCANSICTPGICNSPGLVWVGRNCRNIALLDKFLRK